MAAKKKRKTESKKNKSKNTTQAALSYVLFMFSGFVMYIISKDEYVKFHAMQSIVVFTSLFLLQMALTATLIFALLGVLVNILILVLWILLIYKAWVGDEWEVPILGKFARRFAKKI